MNRWIWFASTMAMLLLILYFGLQLKGAQVENAVALDFRKGAMAFDGYSLAYVDDLAGIRQSAFAKGITIALALQAPTRRKGGFGSVLMLHDGKDQHQLIIGQWKEWLIVMNGDDYDHSRNLPRISIQNFTSENHIRLVHIVADETGTLVYVDGALVETNPAWQMRIPRQGPKTRLVLGNSVTGRRGWRGEIHGLAIYDRAQSPYEVACQHRNWQHEMQFPVNEKGTPIALYTFTSLSNNRVPDLSGNSQTMVIPARAIVLKKEILFPSMQNYRLDHTFAVDVIVNFLGFIPMGFALIALLTSLRGAPQRRLITGGMLFCFFLSMVLEICQAWIYTRTSSWLDLALNTVGACIGIQLFVFLSRHPPNFLKRWL